VLLVAVWLLIDAACMHNLSYHSDPDLHNKNVYDVSEHVMTVIVHCIWLCADSHGVIVCSSSHAPSFGHALVRSNS